MQKAIRFIGKDGIVQILIGEPGQMHCDRVDEARREYGASEGEMIELGWVIGDVFESHKTPPPKREHRNYIRLKLRIGVSPERIARDLGITVSRVRELLAGSK